LEGLFGKVRRRPVLVVENADKNINKIDVDPDSTALGRRIL